ncbi:MAG TPA: chemotaxis protein CheD [Terriglobales bacterium]|nr:chemotaxis protein CheD [Terriglobales bacterium]
MGLMPPKASLPQIAVWLPSDVAAEGGRKRVYLLPGNLHASAEPCQITTILGSCVAICLWDKERRIGGMNHFLLPASPERGQTSSRFADVATGMLLEQLRAAGCQRQDLVAKIFGGAAILQTENHYARSLGAKNVAAAMRLMEHAGIPVVAQETGGGQGRKVVFRTDDGDVWSRRI